MGGWPGGWLGRWLEELKIMLTQLNLNCLFELSLEKSIEGLKKSEVTFKKEK